MIPRLVMLVLTLCQPLLLNRFVNYLSQSVRSESIAIGYGLIAAYGFVYLGIAVSQYQNEAAYIVDPDRYQQLSTAIKTIAS